jgi:calcium/calmodulin-dependent protein kinase I
MKSEPIEPSVSPLTEQKGMTWERFNKDLLNKSFVDFAALQDSFSQLNLSVNDSAGNTTFQECYEQECLLGQGGFADVYRCRHKHRGNRYAVKEILHANYEDETGDTIREEINTMKRLREGCHIIRLLDVFQEPDKTYLIMEEMKGGDLLERIYEKETFSEQEARRLTRKLLEAVRFCHKKKVAHRDIKPENILMMTPKNDTDIKLADFGCAKYMPKPNCLMTLCGSTQYTAPELYTHKNGYNERCDFWSIGIVIFILLGGYAPFDGDDEDMTAIICAGKFSFHPSYWEYIPEPPKDVIRSLLRVDPNERATLEETMDSEWLRRRDVESLNLDGSCSTFDAWVRRQNESSESISLEGSFSNSRTTYKFDTSNICHDIGEHNNEEDDDDQSEGSLSIRDL